MSACTMYQPSSGSVAEVALNETGKVRVTWSRRIWSSDHWLLCAVRRRGTTSYTTHLVPGSSTTSYTITNLNRGTVYEVRVVSVGPLGLSGYCCGSGKQVMTYMCKCNALKVYVIQIDHLLIHVGHCLCLLCIPEPLL